MDPFFEQQDLFIAGEGGYVGYRIPALAVSASGTILAFCEARKYSGRDTDQIDLFVRRSADNGQTFDGIRVVATAEDWVCGNPAPVVDRETGVIWLLFCKNRIDGDEGVICEGKAPRTVWVTHSADDGETWAEPREITDNVKRANWSWYATGPGHGIQLRNGRLVIPCDHIVLQDCNRQDPYFSHIIYSDDHGKTWRIGGSADEGTNESTVVETMDGWLYFNCRNKYRLADSHQFSNQEADSGNFRAVAWSVDGGESFAPIVHDAALPEPICQGSVVRFTNNRQHDRNRILFSNPGTRAGRHTLTVRLSYDECRTWPVAKALYEGPAAYSDLCIAPDMTICCFYERGDERPYERITLARFNLAWLTGGADLISKNQGDTAAALATNTTPDDELTHFSVADRNLFTYIAYAQLTQIDIDDTPSVYYEPSSPSAQAILTTRPIPSRGDALYVDADIEPGGSLYVTVMDTNGYEIVDSEPVLETVRAGRVSWFGGWSFSQSVRPVALKFALKRARLHAFHFGRT